MNSKENPHLLLLSAYLYHGHRSTEMAGRPGLSSRTEGGITLIRR